MSLRSFSSVLLWIFLICLPAGYGTAAPGDPDTLDPALGTDTSVPAAVSAAVVQPDGKILLGGSFNSVLGVPRRNLARLNADGSLDTAFNPDPSASVMALVLQPDGKILVGGTFFYFQDTVFKPWMARLNSDGTVDNLFDPRPSQYVSSIVLQKDGKVLLAGEFTLLRTNLPEPPVARRFLARLNSDGSPDLGFNPSPDSYVSCLLEQPDGKILLGGLFSTLESAGQTVPLKGFARLNMDGTVDSAFTAPVDRVSCMTRLADGKLLLSAEGGIPGKLGRLNPDGSLDADFSPVLDAGVYSMAVQANGKILLTGSFTYVKGKGAYSPVARKYFARLFPDGTLDMAFDPAVEGNIGKAALQKDGKILLTGSFTSLRPRGAAESVSRKGFARLENEEAYQPILPLDTFRVLWLRGGSAPETGPVTFDLSTDAGVSWTSLGLGLREGNSASWSLSGLSLPGSGLLRARARLAAGNGLLEQLAELPPSPVLAPEIVVEGEASTVITDGGTWDFGALIPGKAAEQVFTIKNIGTAVLTGLMLTKNGTDADDFTITVLPAGTAASAGGRTSFTVRYLPRPGGETRSASLHLASNDADEPVFDIVCTGSTLLPGTADGLNPVGAGSYVNCTAQQADGKLLLGGQLSSVGGGQGRNLARLNVDGTLDTSFNPQPNGDVSGLVVQNDGKILVSGSFNTFQPNGAATPVPRSRMARLNPDGSPDPGFNPNPNNFVTGMALQADGKVLIAGGFTTLQPNGAGTAISRPYAARLNAGGTVDITFNPRPDSPATSVAVQDDGKILLGGGFSTVQPGGTGTAVSRPGFARFLPGGALDTPFNPRPNGNISAIALQADGKILIGGNFTSLQLNGSSTAVSRANVARLNADGTLDTGFDPQADGAVYTMAVQADGKVLLGGTFDFLQPNGAATATARYTIARVMADGTLDPDFNPGAVPARSSPIVYGLSLQEDGGVLMGGNFQTVQLHQGATVLPRNRFARLENDPAPVSLTLPEPGQILWSRGGSAPELQQVAFDLSTDAGVSWSSLGVPGRVPGRADWRLSGLTLPPGGLLRARGRSSGGYCSGSSSLAEQFATIPSTELTPLQIWRQDYFGTTANTGDAADSSDSDHDGLPNLIEWACLLDPTQPGGPQPVVSSESPAGIILTYQRNLTALHAGAVFSVEWSDDLSSAGPWNTEEVSQQILSDDGTAQLVKAMVPRGSASHRFCRLRINSLSE